MLGWIIISWSMLNDATKRQQRDRCQYSNLELKCTNENASASPSLYLLLLHSTSTPCLETCKCVRI